jgi:hypothetical protein
MKREGVPQDGNRWVVVWDRDDRGLFEICNMFFKRKLQVQIKNKPRSSRFEIYLENLPPSQPPSVLTVFHL